MAKSGWYDKFAPLYNAGTIGDYFYRRPRKLAIEQLNLTSGSRVADVFCGTGVDFEPLNNSIGPSGSILAVDGSIGMLNEAQDRSMSLGLSEEDVSFMQADFSIQQESTNCVALSSKESQNIFCFPWGSHV